MDGGSEKQPPLNGSSASGTFSEGGGKIRKKGCEPPKKERVKDPKGR